MPSVSEIARHLNVSKSTVSLALNNKPGVSAQMRQRVLAAVAELRTRETDTRVGGYESMAGSGVLQGGKPETQSIVVLHPAILRSSQVFSDLLQGIQAGAAAERIQLNLAVNEPGLPPDHSTRVLLSDPNLRPHGVLVIGARMEEPLIEEAQRVGLPVALVGRQIQDPHLSAAGRDEEGIAYEAASYLLELGHRAIAFVGGEQVYSYTHSRLAGYRRALRDADIEPLPQWVALGDGRSAAQRIVETCPEVTAAIFINDAFAMEGLPIFKEAGKRIPADLSVISFDDTDEARQYDPPLTSVAYPRYLEGYWALKLLLERIRQPLIVSNQVVFQATLVKRQSCAPPKHK